MLLGSIFTKDLSRGVVWGLCSFSRIADDRLGLSLSAMFERRGYMCIIISDLKKKKKKTTTTKREINTKWKEVLLHFNVEHC